MFMDLKLNIILLILPNLSCKNFNQDIGNLFLDIDNLYRKTKDME
jgi:hypothetical protein